MFHDIIINVAGALAWAVRSLIQAPASIVRSLRLALKGDWWSALDLGAGLAVPFIWAWAFGPIALVPGAFCLLANIRQALRWRRGEQVDANRTAPDFRDLRLDILMGAGRDILDLEWRTYEFVAMLYMAVIVVVLFLEGMLLPAMVGCILVTWVYMTSNAMVFIRQNEVGRPMWREGGNPFVQALCWMANIPWKTARGYTILDERAIDKGLITAGPAISMLLSPLNAFVIYFPKFLRRVFGKSLGSIRGVIVISPLVTIGLAAGSAWAWAILGHEFGHIDAYDSCKWDWWWWLGFLGVEIVARLAPPAGWILHAIITLINEAWASVLAFKSGYARGAEGTLTLVLAWSTYLAWATSVFHDVMAGLDPSVTQSV